MAHAKGGPLGAELIQSLGNGFYRLVMGIRDVFARKREVLPVMAHVFHDDESI
jgi:hypothetical protein